MTVDQLSRISRWKAYFGSAIFITAIGLLFVNKIQTETVIYLHVANLFSFVFSFVVNDVEDAEQDSLDPKKRKRNPVSSGELSKEKANFLSLLTAVISAYFYLILGLDTFLLGLFGLLVAYAYSFKRIRLKAIPGLDLISHGLFLGTIQLITVFSVASNFSYISFVPIFLILNIFLGSILVDLKNEIRDIKVDKESNIVNTVIYLNLHRYEGIIKIAYILNLTILGIFLLLQIRFQISILHIFLLTTILGIFILNYIQTSRYAPSYFHNQSVLALLGIFLMV